MSSQTVERTGSQLPQWQSLPQQRATSAGAEAVDLAAIAGLNLYPWQAWCLEHALAEQSDGQWSAFEVGLIVPRQNGKGSVLEARQLAGLTLLHERLQVHTAHEYRTSYEHFLRMVQLVESCPDIDRLVQRVRRGTGEHAIEMRSGARLRFLARTGGSGRGLSGDAVYLDEAFALTRPMMGALLPTLSARPNPQLWYASSAPLETSDVLHDLRKRGHAGTSPRLFFAEWGNLPGVAVDDADALYAANPSLGLRILESSLLAERDASPEDEYRRERLGVPDEPPSTSGPEPKLDPDLWRATVTAERVEPEPGACVFAFDIHRDWCAVVIGMGTLAAPYVEVTDYRTGDGWLPNRILELVRRYRPVAIGLDGASGPAVAVLGVIRERLEENGIDPDICKPLTTTAYRAACGGLLRSVADGSLRRPLVNPDQLETAGLHGSERIVGDSWLWDRRNATVTLSPLIAATVARSLLSDKAAAEPEPFYVY
jgi:hypothetical protein